ncbi:Spy0128 family protein [Streptococcus hillyeri]|uniref:LPXTG cell wall anchor domain-containing protein n=1 Tax=Streptococcus hillyeri TaxID=2282420 RepID=A0A3L9DR33_9STRE|nr:FctA domain-containing protein [Streptococcus hillyeri]RLY03781.1 LPXTG cell wall anchor domain-containing protein [Streptococcus hillyeri]
MKFKWLSMLSLLFLILGIISVPKWHIKANEITDYSGEATLYYDPDRSNIQITSETVNVVAEPGVDFRFVNKLSFPDSQIIKEGDTLVLKIPEEFNLITVMTFPVKNAEGTIVAQAVANPETDTITLTFTDHFSKVPENKKLEISFDAVIDRSNVADGEKMVQYGGGLFKFTFKNNRGSAGFTEMKYGYQDAKNPDQIQWRIVINAGQSVLEDLVIVDSFGENQTLVEGSLRIVDYAKQPEAIKSEDQLWGLDALTNLTDKAILNRNVTGDVTGFTLPYGNNEGRVVYFEYATHIPEDTVEGATLSNDLSWSSTTTAGKVIEALVKLQAGSGKASSEKSENVVLKATKLLEGRELKEGEFTFALYAADNLTTPLQTKTNANDGTVTFDTIRYSQEGVYQYVIKELAGSNQEISYDSTEYHVTVSVTDVNGVKMGEVSYDQKPVFKNVYTPITTESTTEVTTESTTESTTEATTESTTESTTEATTDSTTESTTETTTESTTDSTTESTTETTTESTTESTTEATTESTTESTTETTTESTTESTTEATTESTTESTTEATTESTTESTTETTTESTTESTTEGKKKTPKLPKTGDASGLSAFVAGAALLTLGMLSKKAYRKK